MKKLNIAILCGGKSAEHEVSLQSALNIYKAIDKNKFNPILIGISKSGKWLLGDDKNFILNPSSSKNIALSENGDEVVLIPASQGKFYNIIHPEKSFKIDVIFPMLHGPFGEDGTVQGLLKLAQVPFVGAGVLGSAVGMDKVAMKRLLTEAQIKIAKYLVVHFLDEKPSFEDVVERMGSPFFVKPANMGSSVGISKVKNAKQYSESLDKAFQYDLKVLIEEYVKGREIECSVLGFESVTASLPGEIKPQHDFYSYEAKYIDEDGAILEIPAQISKEKTLEVQVLAIKVFEVLFCEGLGRVDFFLKSNGDLLVNEINTMPGFSKISMYPKLWEASGLSYAELIDRLIELAIARFNKEKKIKTRY